MSRLNLLYDLIHPAIVSVPTIGCSIVDLSRPAALVRLKGCCFTSRWINVGRSRAYSDSVFPLHYIAVLVILKVRKNPCRGKLRKHNSTGPLIHPNSESSILPLYICTSYSWCSIFIGSNTDAVGRCKNNSHGRSRQQEITL